MPSRVLGLLSVVAPVYNEQETLHAFHSRVAGALEGLEFELILVDDGSSDDSGSILAGLAHADPRVRVVSLSRNFGHQMALTAGLDHAAGDVVVMLDADLQDPPEVIVEMLDRWRAGADVIYAVRDARDGESRFKLQTARWFYQVFDWLSSVQLRHNSGDFRMLDRQALNALLSMRETSRFLRGMTVWIGYTQASVLYRRDSRYAGSTKFTVRRMARFSLDALTSFSHRPLQLATLLGIAISMISLVTILAVLVLKFVGLYYSGFSTVEITILFLGGLQLFTIGLVGEYVGRIFDEVKGRPLYLVDARRNFGPPLIGLWLRRPGRGTHPWTTTTVAALT